MKNIFALLMLSCFCAFGQNTNSTNAPDVQQAIGTLIHALVPNVGMEQITTILGALFLLARVLRKAIPDHVQTGGLGTFLKHIALEINPQETPTPANVQKPTVELVGQTSGEVVKPEPVNPPSPAQPKV